MVGVQQAFYELHADNACVYKKDVMFAHSIIKYERISWRKRDGFI
ncbi:hypothetical protein OS42_21490 [Dickeya oryzae]